MKFKPQTLSFLNISVQNMYLLSIGQMKGKSLTVYYIDIK